MKRLLLKSKSIVATAVVLASLLSLQCRAFPLKEQQNRKSLFVPMTTAARSGVGSSSNSMFWGYVGTDKAIQYSISGSKSMLLFDRIQSAGAETDISVIDDVDENDYLVLDSLNIPNEERPSLIEALQNPRDALALLLLVPLGGSVSICNIFGVYTDQYDSLVEASAWLGILSGLAAFLQIANNYKITNHSRRLLVNDDAVNVYAGLYALAVSWLALRTGNHCPEWLASDTNSVALFLPWLCIGIFLGSAIVPTITLWNPGNILKDTPALTDTELLRARGLLAIGILASVFAPDCLAFALGGSGWWDRVSDIHVSQRTLESSTSLFALYANEASMISHRCGREGVAPFRLIVPVFAAVCLLFAIFPCMAALYWLGNDVSFFSFYRV